MRVYFLFCSVFFSFLMNLNLNALRTPSEESNAFLCAFVPENQPYWFWLQWSLEDLESAMMATPNLSLLAMREIRKDYHEICYRGCLAVFESCGLSSPPEGYICWTEFVESQGGGDSPFGRDAKAIWEQVLQDHMARETRRNIREGRSLFG